MVTLLEVGTWFTSIILSMCDCEREKERESGWGGWVGSSAVFTPNLVE